MTKKEYFLLGLGISSLSLALIIAGGVQASKMNAKAFRLSGLDHYTLTLDSSKSPASLTSSYQETVSGSFNTDLGNSIDLNFVKAKKNSSGFVELASRGMIYNYASEDGGISGITAITVDYTGSLMGVRTSLANELSNGTPIANTYSIADDVRLELPSPRYFSLIAADGGNVIKSITIEYTCSLNTDVSRLNGQYTGAGNDGYTYSMFINNGSVSVNSLDRVSSISFNGDAVLNSNALSVTVNAPSTLSGLVYTFNADAQGHALTFASKSGTNANLVPEIDFYRVYTVEDFESYSSTGNGWDTYSNATQYTSTGLRGDYISEYTSSGASSGPIGGSGWALMGSSDYLNFTSNKGYENSKGLTLKGSTNAMRFFQANGYYGIPTVIGKGNKLSFRSKGAYSNSALTTESSLQMNLTVYAFYTQKVSSSTIDQRTEKTFMIPGGDSWEEFTMDLEPTKTYYSIGFYCKHAISGTRYLPLDDFNIYTESPYGEDFTCTPAGNFRGQATRTGNSAYTILAFAGSHNQINYRIAGVKYEATYSISGDTVSIAVDSSYIGTLSGTWNRSTNQITGCSFSGTIKREINNNGSIVLSELEHTWKCDDDAEGLRNVFRRRWNGGSWAFDDSNEDRILSSNNSISGHAIRRRGYTGGGVSLVLKNDLSPITVNNLCFWVYNPSSSDITLRQWVYRASGLGSNLEVSGNVPAAANSWTFITLGFASSTVYNFQLADFTKSGVALSYDNISLY